MRRQNQALIGFPTWYAHATGVDKPNANMAVAINAAAGFREPQCGPEPLVREIERCELMPACERLEPRREICCSARAIPTNVESKYNEIEILSRIGKATV